MNAAILCVRLVFLTIIYYVCMAFPSAFKVVGFCLAALGALGLLKGGMIGRIISGSLLMLGGLCLFFCYMPQVGKVFVIGAGVVCVLLYLMSLIKSIRRRFNARDRKAKLADLCVSEPGCERAKGDLSHMRSEMPIQSLADHGSGQHHCIVLGRSRTVDIRLVESDVSRRHLEIARGEGGIVAVCLSPHVMTTVNGAPMRVAIQYPLHEGDVVKLGRRTEVRVVKLPKDENEEMSLCVQDGRGVHQENVRLMLNGDLQPCDDGCSVDRTVVANTDEIRQIDDMVCYKPVIYLYPEVLTQCSVRLRLNGRLTCTYPAHGSCGWRDFLAAPDGVLIFPDKRRYYCLYWEGNAEFEKKIYKGYCVKGCETAEFLSVQLLKMGLSFREANEFIIYWLPRMQNNPYNVIAFLGEEYARSVQLEIEPAPDSVLRVFMTWKASDGPVDIPAPTIEPFERRGFTVVEWGGTEIGR